LRPGRRLGLASADIRAVRALELVDQRPRGGPRPEHAAGHQQREADPEVDVHAGRLVLDLVVAEHAGADQQHAVDPEHRADDPPDVEQACCSLDLLLAQVGLFVGHAALLR